MTNKEPISMFDNVRVRSTPVTIAMELVGLTGQVYGMTTPSVTGIEALGDTDEDVAINVHFEDRSGEFWFAPKLLEFIDHAPGTRIQVKGVNEERVRTESGEWMDNSTGERDQSVWRIVRRLFGI